MKQTVTRSIFTFSLALLLFVGATYVEKIFGMTFLGLWLLCYMVERRVSIQVLFFLSLFYDLLFLHALGVTTIFLVSLSIGFFVLERVHLRPLLHWLSAVFIQAIWITCIGGGRLPPLSFWMLAFLFLPLYIYGFRIYRSFLVQHL